MLLHEIEAEIRQLHARYTDAVWRKDPDHFGSCFTHEAEWRIAGHTLIGRGAISEFMRYAFEKYERILMTFRTPIIHIANDAITARTYVSEQSVVLDGNRGYAPIGRYFERFAHEDGEWRFSWRLFQTLYIGLPDLSGQFLDVPDYGPPPGFPPLDAQTVNASGLL